MRKLTKHGKESYQETAKILFYSYVILTLTIIIVIFYEYFK